MIRSFTGEFAFLSNFYLCRTWGDNMLYPSVEHAFQASKTFDEDERLKIAEAKTPAEAKRLGRYVTLRSDWEIVKDGVMFDLLSLKFEEHSLRSSLIATRPRILVEGNTWNDTYWGVCNGKGQNRLGQLLMLVRSLAILDS